MSQWLLTGAISGILLGMLDSAVLGLVARHMFVDGVELMFAILGTVLMCAMAGAVISGPGWAVESVVMRLRPQTRPFVLTFFLAPLWTALFWLLSSGPSIAQFPLRLPIVLFTGFLSGAAWGWIIVRGSMVSRPVYRRLMALLCCVVALAMVGIDFVVLVRLYPPFHLALTVLAACLLIFSGLLGWPTRFSDRGSVRAAALVLVFVVAGGFSLGRIGQTQNIRFVICDKTATAVEVMLPVSLLVGGDLEMADESSTTESESHKQVAMARHSLKRPGATVLLITVDAMRYDRLQPGNVSDTAVAPTMNALATQSVVFERAYTPVPHTCYALASLMTGKYIRPLFYLPGVDFNQQTWPEIMADAGYVTGGFYSGSVYYVDPVKFRPLQQKNYGFTHAQVDYIELAGPKVTQTIAFLDKTRKRGIPQFAWVHLFDPHAPYRKTCTRFGTSAEQRYDCEIFNADQEIQRLLAYVEIHYPDAIIIATADHGEEFMDHGGMYHTTTLYDEQVRVPLMMRIPGVEPSRVTAPVSLVDIAGTLMSIVDIPPPAALQSQNMSDLILGRDDGQWAAYARLSRTRMVVFDNHKLIWDKATHLFQLYDLLADPGERISIAEQRPRVLRRLKRKLKDFEKSHLVMEQRPPQSTTLQPASLP
ncbi:MAG: sulfatase-like hydrolase/transferase [Deltaproteobacteria bacterium]|nr:sulfatase-like hydrolase/transferase [Deltaproteobacteria bacterium]